MTYSPAPSSPEVLATDPNPMVDPVSDPVLDPISTPQPVKKPLSWQRGSRYLYLRLIRLKSTPGAIARGLAVGVFAGFFPIFGFQTIAAVLLAIPFRGNKLVAAAGTWISNPFTYVPIYLFNFQVGQWLLGRAGQGGLATARAVFEADQNWLQLGSDVVTTLFTGCAFTGGIAAVIAYGVGLWGVDYLRQRRQK